MRHLLLFLSIIIPSSLVGQQLMQTFYDSEGKPLKEEFRVNEKGELDGDYTSFFENGNLKSTGFFANNKSTGEWSYYFSSGEIRMKGSVSDGKNVGVWNYFYESGGKKMEGELENGKRTGLWKIYNTNGIKQSEGHFDGNTKIGTWKYFCKSGELKAIEAIEEDRTVYTEFYVSGNKKASGDNFDSKKNGEWLYFFEDGSLQAKGTYREGKKFGAWKYYNESGSIKAEGNYFNDVTDGVWIHYYESGAIQSKGVLSKGQKDGAWSLFYEDGSVKSEANYQLGNGEYVEYYKNGSLKITGKVANSKNDGIWHYYYESGFLEGECNFVNGEGEFVGYYPPTSKKRIKEGLPGKKKMQGIIRDERKIGVWELYEANGDLAGYYKPYYEGENEGFLLEKETGDKKVLSEPKRQVKLGSYGYSNNKSKYFSSKLNEHRAYIVNYNPVGVFYNISPFGVEYYMEERLGYELLGQYLRGPFLKSFSSIEDGIVYSEGFSASVRQKFYQRSTDFGVPYFAHELRYTQLQHITNVNNIPSLGVTETKYEYAILVGVRYFKYKQDNGFTADVFLGAATGYRDFDQTFQTTNNFVNPFSNLNSNMLSISLRAGFHLGYTFKTRKF